MGMVNLKTVAVSSVSYLPFSQRLASLKLEGFIVIPHLYLLLIRVVQVLEICITSSFISKEAVSRVVRPPLYLWTILSEIIRCS